MREIDEILNRRPDLGTVAGEAGALRAQLSRQRGAASPGASALTAAELRILPLLATHLTDQLVAVAVGHATRIAAEGANSGSTCWSPPSARRKSPRTSCPRPTTWCSCG